MGGAQVGVFEETNEVGFSALLEGHDGRALKMQVGLEVLGDFPDETLEGQLADEKMLPERLSSISSCRFSSGHFAIINYFQIIEHSGKQKKVIYHRRLTDVFKRKIGRCIWSENFPKSFLRYSQNISKDAEKLVMTND